MRKTLSLSGLSFKPNSDVRFSASCNSSAERSRVLRSSVGGLVASGLEIASSAPVGLGASGLTSLSAAVSPGTVAC